MHHVQFKTKWMGHLNNLPCCVVLTIGHTDKGWLWTADLVWDDPKATEPTILWEFSHRSLLLTKPGLLPLYFSSKDEAYRQAAEWLSNQGFQVYTETQETIG